MFLFFEGIQKQRTFVQTGPYYLDQLPYRDQLIEMNIWKGNCVYKREKYQAL